MIVWFAISWWALAHGQETTHDLSGTENHQTFGGKTVHNFMPSSMLPWLLSNDLNKPITYHSFISKPIPDSHQHQHQSEHHHYHPHQYSEHGLGAIWTPNRQLHQHHSLPVADTNGAAQALNQLSDVHSSSHEQDFSFPPIKTYPNILDIILPFSSPAYSHISPRAKVIPGLSHQHNEKNNRGNSCEEKAKHALDNPISLPNDAVGTYITMSLDLGGMPPVSSVFGSKSHATSIPDVFSLMNSLVQNTLNVSMLNIDDILKVSPTTELTINEKKHKDFVTHEHVDDKKFPASLFDNIDDRETVNWLDSIKTVNTGVENSTPIDKIVVWSTTPFTPTKASIAAKHSDSEEGSVNTPLLKSLNLKNEHHGSIVNIDSLELEEGFDPLDFKDKEKAIELRKALSDMAISGNMPDAISFESSKESGETSPDPYSSLKQLSEKKLSQMFNNVWTFLTTLEDKPSDAPPKASLSYSTVTDESNVNEITKEENDIVMDNNEIKRESEEKAEEKHDLEVAHDNGAVENIEMNQE